MRTPVTVKIKFKSASLDQFIERYSVDVSKGGIFIRTSRPLSVGTALKFEFQLADGKPLLCGDGTVVWVRDAALKEGASPGMGVRFDELPSDSREVLGRVLAQKSRAEAFGMPEAEPPVAEDMPLPTALDEPPAMPEEPVLDDLPEPRAAEPVIDLPEPRVAEPVIDLPEPRAAEPVIDLPEPRAAQPGIEPAQEPKPPRDVVKENLGRVIFSDEDGDGDMDEARPAAAVADGAKPLTPIREPRPTPPRPEPAVSARALPEEEERKSSAVVWIIIVLMLAAAGFVYWKYFHEKKGEVVVAADVGVEAPRPDLAPVPAPSPRVSMRVESTPEGARIIVDGKDTGQVTPAHVEGLEADVELELALDLPGKKLHAARIKPTPTPYQVEITEAAERKIRITSEPPGAKIYLDGKSVGTTPHDVTRKLRPRGSYEVKLTLEGFRSHQLKLVPGNLTWTRDGVDEISVVSAALEAAPVKPRAAPRRTPRRQPRQIDDDVDDEGGAGDDEPAAPPAKPRPDASPAKPKPDAPPARTEPAAPPAEPEPAQGIKKPSWSE